MSTDQKAIWQRYCKERRDALISKVEDLSEYEARMPRTPTGTNLIGIIKHVLNVEAVYLGTTFGTPVPLTRGGTGCRIGVRGRSAGRLVRHRQRDHRRHHRPLSPGDRALQADRRTAGSRHRQPRPALGWREVTLHWILVHNFNDLAQHNGQADILREQVDGSVGWRRPGDNVPDGYDWPAYVAKLTGLADRFRDEPANASANPGSPPQ